MNEKDEKFVVAAMQCVAKFGIKRTTMADVAQQANVSRPTLYNSFSNKEALLSACVAHHTNTSIENMHTAWENTTAAADILDIYFEHAIINSYDIMAHSPETREMLLGNTMDISNAVATANSNYCEALTTRLKPFETNLSKCKQTPKQLASFIVMASKGFKMNAKSRKELHGLLNSLKISALGMLETN